MIDQNDYSMIAKPPEPTQEEARAMHLQKEDVELREFNVEGKRMLAGFSQLGYVLLVGIWNGT